MVVLFRRGIEIFLCHRIHTLFVFKENVLYHRIWVQKAQEGYDLILLAQLAWIPVFLYFVLFQLSCISLCKVGCLECIQE